MNKKSSAQESLREYLAELQELAAGCWNSQRHSWRVSTNVPISASGRCRRCFAI